MESNIIKGRKLERKLKINNLNKKEDTK